MESQEEALDSLESSSLEGAPSGGWQGAAGRGHWRVGRTHAPLPGAATAQTIPSHASMDHGHPSMSAISMRSRNDVTGHGGVWETRSLFFSADPMLLCC